jgi:hypothetical protein
LKLFNFDANGFFCEIAITISFALAIENALPVRLCLGSLNIDGNKMNEINTYD